MNYQVLLYYKYTTIDDPEQFAQDHLAFCKAHHLKGRILVSTEGINGTLSGTKEETEQYMAHMHADERFKDMVFKIDEAEGHAFKKMHVRPRKEIVALDLEDDVDPRHTTGQYLSPVEFRKALEDDDTVIIDARNDYEFDLGHFRGAISQTSHALEIYLTGLKRIKRYLQIKKWLRTVQVAFDVKNFLDGF